MIAYRFIAPPEYPKHGVLVGDSRQVPAKFFTVREAKREAPLPIPFKRMTVARIQEAVANYYGLSLLHMQSASRCRGHVYPRQMAMLLSRQLTKASLPEIGQRFGGRDHSTVFHGIRSAQARIDTDPTTSGEYDTLRLKLSA